jgi:hypothetical protein
VVAQGIEVQNADSMPKISSRSLDARDFHDASEVLTGPLASSVLKISQQHPDHPPTCHHEQLHAIKKTTSLFAIEVTLLFLLEL